MLDRTCTKGHRNHYATDPMYFGQKIESKIRVNLNIRTKSFLPLFFAVPFKVEPKFNTRRRTSSVTTTTFSSPRLQPPSLIQTGPQNCRLDALSPRLLPPAPQHSVSIWRNLFHNYNYIFSNIIGENLYSWPIFCLVIQRWNLVISPKIFCKTLENFCNPPV